MKQLLFVSITFLLFISNFSHALTHVPVFQADYETDELPTGFEESDDAVIWVDDSDSTNSLVLGVNKAKIKHGGQAGLGVYDLKGNQVQYFQHDRLNNVDLRYDFFGIDIAAGSNRDKKAISLFSVSKSGVKLLGDFSSHTNEEPYGLCMQKNLKTNQFYVWLPMKSGMLYRYEIKNRDKKIEVNLMNSIDTSQFLSRDQDNRLINLIVTDVIHDPSTLPDELEAELHKEISERFQLEGCVADDENDLLYLGMENLGVWKIDTNHVNRASLIFEVQKSKHLKHAKDFPVHVPRAVNDIEGITLYKTDSNQNGALIVSVQGINEYAVLDRQTNQYLGSFEVDFPFDPVTETDGITVSSKPIGEFKDGLMILHDHHNTDQRGNILKANYKYLGMSQFLNQWPQFRP